MDNDIALDTLTLVYGDIKPKISDNTYAFPAFQRDLVWDMNHTAKLLDSILKGYPIGNIIAWSTKQQFETHRVIEGTNKRKIKNDLVRYILDGQQRLSSIYAAFEGISIITNGKERNYRDIYVNLDLELTDEDVITNEVPNGPHISVCEIINKNMPNLVKEYSGYLDKIEQYGQRLLSYKYQMILLENYSMDDAANVFTRINTTGVRLDLFELIRAKTYKKDTFDLLERFESLEERLNDFEITKRIFLQSLSANIKNGCDQKTILQLNNKDIYDACDRTSVAIYSARDYFKSNFNISMTDIMPYLVLIIPIQYFYYHNKDSPTEKQRDMLNEYFWRSSFYTRFESTVNGRLKEDLNRITNIIENKRLPYDKTQRVTLMTAEDIIKIPFTPRNVRCRSILCMFASLNPRSFRDGTKIFLDDSNLSKKNNKNYHHFFPKAYLHEKNILNSDVVANITLIDAEFNKKIGKKSPSSYITDFAENDLENILKTHLINDMKEYGIYDNDYDIFLKKRSQNIFEKIKELCTHTS